MDIFREHGFDNMDLICSINEKNLELMGIYKQGHINSFTKFVKSDACNVDRDKDNSDSCVSKQFQ